MEISKNDYAQVQKCINELAKVYRSQVEAKYHSSEIIGGINQAVIMLKRVLNDMERFAD